MLRKIPSCPARIASRPCAYIPYTFTKSASSANGAANPAASPAFHASCSPRTSDATSLSIDGDAAMLSVMDDLRVDGSGGEGDEEGGDRRASLPVWAARIAAVPE